jgi:hypothetical protein
MPGVDSTVENPRTFSRRRSMKMQDANPARFSVSGPRRRTGSGTGYQVPGTRDPIRLYTCIMHTRCARFPVGGLGLRCSVFGPWRRFGSGAGYQVPGAR